MKRLGAPSLRFAITIALAIAPAAAAASDESPDDFFESKVRPLLVARCQECHSGDSPKARLALTSRAALLTGGRSGPAAVPGAPEESLLIDVVHYDAEPRMPPKGRLTDPEIDALARWVALGLPWPDAEAQAAAVQARPTIAEASATHWAFQPVRDVDPPALTGEAQPRNPIDAFILARLRAEGLSPSPPADRRTLIRRLSFDLTGLPPTPEDVRAFEADRGPLAYERLVDRLLASPRHGEHSARPWLDIARYSDTKGYVYAREEARWVHAWAYRDWVARALNSDLPYDRFLLLQIAADQVADDPADLPAMGFLTLGRRFLGVTHDIIDDRIDVVTRGALGLTVACARCHDHKFDPIPTADYYSLYGVFRNSAERVVPATPDPSTAADGPFEQGLRERRARLDDRLTEARRAASERVRRRVLDYLLAQSEMEKYPEEGFDQLLAPGDLFPSFVRRWRDFLRRTGPDDPIFAYWHDPTSAAPGLNLRLARAFEQATADRAEVARRYGDVFTSIIHRWESARAASLYLGSPAPVALPDPGDEAIRRVLYGPDSPCEVPDEPIVGTEWFFPTTETVELWKLQGEVDRWLIQSDQSPAYATILADRDPTVGTRVFRRGDPSNLGDEVPRHFLQIVAGPDPAPFAQGSGRLELAHAITDPANPLTARVAVNRIWMGHFGQGLVRTPGDFGTRAEPPSHPELLDWLAARFLRDGWHPKALHRLIVTSAAYRQSSLGPADPEARAASRRLDPENRLLGRATPHRLTFEELRDALLAATGELDPRIGGKPVALLSPPYPARRTLYGLTDRENFPALYRAFDVANPDLLIPRRPETIVPQQALFFLNNPFLIGRAQALLSRLEVASEPDPAARVRRLYQALYQRDPTEAQLTAALDLVDAIGTEPAPTPSPTAAAWSYGHGRLDESTGRVADFRPLPFFNGKAWQGGESWPDPALGWVQLHAAGGHPGNDRAHAAVRRWTAPRAGRVQVRSALNHDVAGGDGVRGFLVHSRLGIVERAEVHDRSEPFDLDTDVLSGDTIDFLVDIRDDLNSDQFLWAPTITLSDSAEPSSWNASSDFAGPTPIRLDPWSQLAQVLLMANEFTFID